ncbi:MAG: tetratricopeptide repeat protein [Candidatus Cloacimonetes bacterium]|nr:tetratricopeptide repeat protein [Candidatus Cloacimonadota bacterium]
MMKKLALLSLLALCTLLLAQYDEKEIMIKKAQRLINQRQYENADQIYVDLLRDYPGDPDIVEKYISNLLRQNKTDKADEVLEDYRPQLADIDYIRQKIAIQLSQGQVRAARDHATDYIRENAGKISDYKILANVFERFREYEKALDIYLEARKAAKDQDLYSRELAHVYENLSRYDKALSEYLNYLESNEKYLNFIYNRIKNILSEEPDLLAIVENVALTSINPNVREIYGLCLGDAGQLDRALEVYESLDAEKLEEFAARQLSAGNYETALKAYEAYQERIKEPYLQADAKIEIARIYLSLNMLTDAERILRAVYDDEEITRGKFRYKTSASRLCREMLAEIALRRGDPGETVLSLLEEAKQFTFNKKLDKEIDYKIIHYYIMNEDYQLAKEKLHQQMRDEEIGTETYKSGFYYLYLLAVMTGDPAADSLLGEVIINIPENEVTNDALDLFVVSGELDREQKAIYLQAFRERQLLKTDKAIDLLLELYETARKERILVIAGQWALTAGMYDRAREIYSYQFEQEIDASYAELMRTRMILEKTRRNMAAVDFLKNNAGSVFAPAFRQLIVD